MRTLLARDASATATALSLGTPAVRPCSGWLSQPPVGHVHGGPPVEWAFTRLYNQQNFRTPWRFVHTGMMSPGAGIGEHIHAQCEEMFFGIDNTMHYIHNGRKIEVPGPAFVVCRAGESHGALSVRDVDSHLGHQTPPPPHHPLAPVSCRLTGAPCLAIIPGEHRMQGSLIRPGGRRAGSTSTAACPARPRRD
eukprot:SAG22_NODE_350_length_11853_cov_3.693211_3_plen_193_part_00